MSRKRYSSGSKGTSPYQGNQKSTSTQQSGYEESLTAECLIRSFMEKGNMEDPILKTLFIGGSRPKEGETEGDLMFRRMVHCWLDKKSKNYGMRELIRLKMKECQIDSDVDGRWAKYSLMRAPLIITPKIWINKQGDEKRFLKDFQLDVFRNDKNLSECAVRINQKGYGLVQEFIDARMIIHKWNMFPDKEPLIWKRENKRKTFHLIIDDMDVLHHVILHRSQLDILESYYEDPRRDQIQLVQQDWSQFISIARGRKKLLTIKVKKSSRDTSRESSQIRQMQIIPEQQQIVQHLNFLQPIIEEKMSDQESQQSKEKLKKLRVESQVTGFAQPPISQKMREMEDIKVIEESLLIAQTIEGDQGDIFLPKKIFPEGLVKFAEKYGTNSYLKLFMKLNYEYLKLDSKTDWGKQEQNKTALMHNLKDRVIKQLKFTKAESYEQINLLEQNYYGLIDALYNGSDMMVFTDQQRSQIKLIEFRMRSANDIIRYFKIIQEREEVKQILTIMNEILKTFGIARLAFDELMICPFCALLEKETEIFKHSCVPSIDLAIRRGRQQ